jgi:hypothetical protein
MQPITPDELERAFDWVSAAPEGSNSAVIAKESGLLYFGSEDGDCDEDFPADADDPDLYWSVPHKNELDLGNRLVFRFAEQQLPEHENEVRNIFRRKGAYRAFHALIDRLGVLQNWYTFEASETRAALLAWAEREGLPVERSSS